jgi:hypothetical protein
MHITIWILGFKVYIIFLWPIGCVTPSLTPCNSGHSTICTNHYWLDFTICLALLGHLVTIKQWIPYMRLFSCVAWRSRCWIQVEHKNIYHVPKDVITSWKVSWTPILGTVISIPTISYWTNLIFKILYSNTLVVSQCEP